MHRDDLRRTPRLRVCCRADVRDRHGVWTAITEDVCARGCGLLTPKLPRVGSVLELIAEPLEVLAEAAWASDDRVGAIFLEHAVRAGALSPSEWIDEILEHGRVLGPEAIGAESPRVVPVVLRRGAGAHALGPRRAAQERAPRPEAGASVIALPVAHR
jgi:hypothetical protein